MIINLHQVLHWVAQINFEGQLIHMIFIAQWDHYDHSQDELLWNLYKRNDQDSLIFNSLTSSSYCHTPKIGAILNFVGWAPTRRLPLRKTLMKPWSRYVDWYCVGNSSSMMAYTLWRWLWYVHHLSLAMAWPSHTHILRNLTIIDKMHVWWIFFFCVVFV